MYSLKKTVVAIALAFPAVAFAQQDLKAELDALKAKVKQLESMVEQVGAKADKAGGGMDAETRTDFNRMKLKVEAADEELESSGLKGLKISGYIDPTYIYNQRQRTSSVIFMSNFDDANDSGSNLTGGTSAYSYDNGFFGSAMIKFEKELEGGTKWLLELMPHKSIGAGGGFNIGSIVNQAYVSIPLGSPNDQFLAGQVGSWSGYEYGAATQKKTITNNLLFDFIDPTFITGFGYTNSTGNWATKFIVGNLNAGRITDRRAPVLHWRGDYSMGEYAGVGFGGIHGKSSASTTINSVEVDGYLTRADWNFQGQIEVGQNKRGAYNTDDSGNAKDAKWLGLSALASYKITPRLEGITRFDYIKNDKNGGGLPSVTFNDDSNGGGSCADAAANPVACGDYRNGFGPGIDNATGQITDPDKGANRYALTLGLDYNWTANTLLKFELRYDRATQNVFFDVGSNTYKKDNTLLGVATVISF